MQHQWKPKAIREKEAAEAKAAAEAAAKLNSGDSPKTDETIEKTDEPKDKVVATHAGEDRCHVKIVVPPTQKVGEPLVEKKTTTDDQETIVPAVEEKVKTAEKESPSDDGKVNETEAKQNVPVKTAEDETTTQTVDEQVVGTSIVVVQEPTSAVETPSQDENKETLEN